MPDKQCCFSALLPKDLSVPLLLRLQTCAGNASSSRPMPVPALPKKYDTADSHLIPGFPDRRIRNSLSVLYSASAVIIQNDLLTAVIMLSGDIDPHIAGCPGLPAIPVYFQGRFIYLDYRLF